MNKKNEIIVIGAGVAGLTAGIYALKLGYHVHLFEKNPTPGGECTGWDRQGCHIDNCIHWLIGTTPGTDLNKLYKETRLLDEEAGVYRFPLMRRAAMKQCAPFPNSCQADLSAKWCCKPNTSMNRN